MKNLLFFVLFPVIFSGCYVSYNTRFSDLPKPPPTNHVDLYFGSETVRDTAYVKVKIVEVSGGDYNALTNKLQKVGKEEGFDALYVLSQSHSLTASNGYNYNFGGSNLSYSHNRAYSNNNEVALGIRYKRNMGYVSNYIRTQQVFLIDPEDSSKSKKVAEAKLFFDGTPESILADNKAGELYYKQNLERYSVEKLAYQENESWQYIPPSDTTKPIKFRRELDKNGRVARVCKLTYDKENRLEKIKIRYPAYHRRREIVSLYYLEGKPNSIVKKEIKTAKGDDLTEHFLFDSKTKATGSLLYRKTKEGKEIPFIKTSFIYYTIDDL